MGVLENRDVRKALFWACLAAATDTAGALLGVLAVLGREPSIPVRELLESAAEAEVPPAFVAVALFGLGAVGLVEVDEDQVRLKEAGEEAARLAAQGVEKGASLGLTPAGFLELLTETAKELLTAC